MAKKNIGATIALRDAGFFTGIKKAITGTDQLKNHTGGATSYLKKMSAQSAATGNALSGLTKKVTGLVGAYVGVSKLKEGLALGDKLVTNNARLNLMNDGLQTTAQLNDMIFASATRARGAYLETTDAVARLGTLAGNAFSSTEEIVGFSELLNKSFKIGGASAEEQKSAMTQLSQAMASGRLQGDEFSSIMENAPLIADYIAKQMNKPKGALKELSSQGAITSDIIKKAMFGASDEINEKFKEIPMTFADRMQNLKNNGIKKIAPLLNYISMKVLPAIDRAAEKTFKKIKPYIEPVKAALKGVWDFGVSAFNNIRDAVERNMPKFQTLQGVLIDVKNKLFNAFDACKPTINWLKDEGLPLLVDVVGNVIQKSTDLYNYINDNWNNIGPIIEGIVGCLVIYKGALMATEYWTKLVTVATTVWRGAINLWKFASLGGLGVEMAWIIWRGKDLAVTSILMAMYGKDAIIKGIHAAATWVQTGATGALSAAQWLLNAAFFASPIGWIVLGVAALVVAFIALWKNNEGFRNFWINMCDKLKESMKNAVNKIKEIWNGLKEFLKNPIAGTVKLFKKTEEDGKTESISINGSHAGGLSRVPFDGYIARLHKDERVLTASESKQYNNNNNSKPVVIENITVIAKGTTADEVVDEFVPKLKLALANI